MGWIQDPCHEAGDDGETILGIILSQNINTTYAVLRLAKINCKLQRCDNIYLQSSCIMLHHREIYAHPLVMFAVGWPESEKCTDKSSPTISPPFTGAQ